MKLKQIGFVDHENVHNEFKKVPGVMEYVEFAKTLIRSREDYKLVMNACELFHKKLKEHYIIKLCKRSNLSNHNKVILIRPDKVFEQRLSNLLKGDYEQFMLRVEFYDNHDSTISVHILDHDAYYYEINFITKEYTNCILDAYRLAENICYLKTDMRLTFAEQFDREIRKILTGTKFPPNFCAKNF